MRSLLPLLLAALLPGCTRAAPPEPVAGVYAIQGVGRTLRGSGRKPTVRRAQAGVTLTTDMTLELEKGGAVLEAFDGSFLWLPKGRHGVKALRLARAAPDGATRPVVLVGEQAVRKEVPIPLVEPRYEPPESAPKMRDSEDRQMAEDMAFFFTPRGDDEQVEDPAPAAPPAPWMVKDRYVRPLRRPLKAGESGRALVAAKGAVVVEFSDGATCFADALKLPLDLFDVRRVVVADGSARLTLRDGTRVDLASGGVAEIAR